MNKKTKSLNNKRQNLCIMFLIEQKYFIFSSIVYNRASIVVVDIQMIVELAAAAAVDMDQLDMVLK